MTFLLDVNVLVALIDEHHEFAAAANKWFRFNCSNGWATCPITENGALRILTNAHYRPFAMTMEAAIAAMTKLRKEPGHRFWPDDVSLLDAPVMQHKLLHSHGQITDAYLLALAVHRGGQLATFDKRLAACAVVGGNSALHHIAG